MIENHFSDYDQEQVRHFQNAIEFKDGKYYVVASLACWQVGQGPI